jgi:uncharacterized YigZ family protein
MTSDTYKTIAEPALGIYKNKGSRFLSFAFPITSVEEIKPILNCLRKEYHDARHHCFAYLFGHEDASWRIYDDGEPSGTAGRTIMGQIRSFELTNILLVVVRYFGGTLLGVSGLISAYRKASINVLSDARIIDCIIQDSYEIYFPYSSMNDVMKVLKDENISQAEQIFEIECSIMIRFRISLRNKIIEKLSRIDGLRLTYTGTR